MSRGVLQCLRRTARAAAPLAVGLAAVVALVAAVNASGYRGAAAAAAGAGETTESGGVRSGSINTVQPASTPGLATPLRPVDDEGSAQARRVPEYGQRVQQGVPPVSTSRPFQHSQHESLSCRQCHGAGERHRTTTVRTARDCAACHHDPRRATTCDGCHRPAELPAVRRVAGSMALTVWESVRVRILPFAHERHTAFACLDCHRAPVSLAVDRECSACHSDHHRLEANCTSCHPAIEDAVHLAESHLTCAASGCHAPGVVPALSRSLCVMCHAEQKNHEPGSGCTACHHIPNPTTGGKGSGASAAMGRSDDP
jgi:hypothetical protein